MSKKGLVVEFTLPSKKKAEKPAVVPASEPIPRLARLLALAHKWEGMVRRGEVSGYAEIARRMGLSRARVTQVCQLTLLSPRVQEVLLAFTAVDSFATPVRLLRIYVSRPLWKHHDKVARQLTPVTGTTVRSVAPHTRSCENRIGEAL